MKLYIPFESYVQTHKTKQQALFHAIRDTILSGKLQSHDQLPATRQLADQYELSRGTVSNVYDMLVAQGYLYSIIGSGTFVSEHRTPYQWELAHDLPIRLSSWGNRLIQNIRRPTYIHQLQQTTSNINTVNYQNTIDFQLSKVNLTDFPLQEWNKVLFEHIRQQYENETTDTHSTDGHPKLKRSIASQLNKHRGIKIDADQIAIVNGSQQALTLLAHLFIDKGDQVALENPHYIGFRDPIQVLGGVIHTYSVDEDGILFNPNQHDYKFVYVTPNRHFPTGSVLSLARRQQLLSWANKHNTFIIEDDYDSEFNYSTRALEPLKSLDLQDNVIYVGTFSRTMMQYIRIGYVVLPKRLVEPFKLAKSLFERHPISIIEQRALSSFIDSGQYDRHFRRVRRLYRQRAHYFQQHIQARLNHIFSVNPIKAGLHLYANWVGPTHLFHPFLDACKRYNLILVNSEPMFFKDPKPSVCLGFAHLTIDQLEEGIRRLELAWQSTQDTLDS